MFDLESYENALRKAKRIVANEEEPFRSIAFEVILTNILNSQPSGLKDDQGRKTARGNRTLAREGDSPQGASDATGDMFNREKGITFEIPKSIEDKVNDIGERERIPLLWYFSNVKSMTIREFLTAASKRKINFSPSWLPSEGSNFTKRIVKGDKMLVEDGKNGREIKYKMSDVGTLKVEKRISELET